MPLVNISKSTSQVVAVSMYIIDDMGRVSVLWKYSYGIRLPFTYFDLPFVISAPILVVFYRFLSSNIYYYYVGVVYVIFHVLSFRFIIY